MRCVMKSMTDMEKNGNGLLQFVLKHYSPDTFDTDEALERFRKRTGLYRSARWRRISRLAGAAAAVAVLAATGLMLHNARINRWEETTASTVTLPDQSTVRLKDGATLAFQPRRFAKERIVRLNGTGYFEVTRNQGSPFEVHSAEAVVRVLGTRFVFDTESKDIYVSEGQVLFAREGSASGLALNAGEQAVLREESEVPELTALKTPNPDAWATGRVSYNGVPIRDVLDELSTLFGKHLIIVGKQTTDLSLTGEFRLSEGLDPIVPAIESALDITIVSHE